MSSTEFEAGDLDEVTLTDDEAALMRGLCAEAVEAIGNADLGTQATMTTVELLGCRLPERLVAALVTFRCVGSPGGALLVRNVPVDDRLPTTPTDGYLPDWRAAGIATAAQLMVMSHLGNIIGYADEKRGRVVQDVAPIAGAEHQQENSGSAYLELHTENGFHPFKPDFLSLLCLRPDHDRSGQTLTGAATRVRSRLSESCVAVLRQPLFRIQFSSSFAQLGSTGYSEPVAVLSGPADDLELTADFHAMEPMTRTARHALDELDAVLTASLTSVALDVGSLLVVDNWRAVHGRTGFTARYDGTDRWLRRCFAVADLRRSRAVRAAGSRVFAPLTAILADRSPVQSPAPLSGGTGSTISA
ncbi:MULTISPECIES: TauD/TfdA family dioxygenase [Micromonospora]|uniref:TauD/TfdA family dioxygenase n=1 Tax=Micromonospora humidisoli TaxID=2807622 RepID=A0ABS2JCQ2_9ACTN|nr:MULTISPECIES: TauD/TfdA family dioxygenase [Micromonospora]MBM7083845.1 TauD/TfdA family dioxygenase [Micromonospora humidisoli]WKU07230.1 TauD/TfdA family dioxygenase [Micromonospora sp. HUAS LYJ1]GHJ06937.1 L-asparagine oxygenase [Micromonospora sp. AKA109]